jgi:hypothetical protein
MDVETRCCRSSAIAAASRAGDSAMGLGALGGARSDEGGTSACVSMSVLSWSGGWALVTDAASSPETEPEMESLPEGVDERIMEGRRTAVLTRERNDLKLDMISLCFLCVAGPLTRRSTKIWIWRRLR